MCKAGLAGPGPGSDVVCGPIIGRLEILVIAWGLALRFACLISGRCGGGEYGIRSRLLFQRHVAFSCATKQNTSTPDINVPLTPAQVLTASYMSRLRAENGGLRKDK